MWCKADYGGGGANLTKKNVAEIVNIFGPSGFCVLVVGGGKRGE